ncbi:MAG: glycosyltransferase [Novosphingobium sp.]|nr:glycosyltransferase [Novosphingobium sp.]
MSSPVFFDQTGRRRWLVGGITGLLLLIVLVSAAVFASTIVNVPTESPLVFGRERDQPLPFRTHLARLGHRLPGFLWKHNRTHSEPLRIGFYVPWDEESTASLRAHYDKLDWVVASNAQVDPKGGKLSLVDDTELRAIRRSRLHQPRFFLMVQNADEGHWFGNEMPGFFANRAASDRVIQQTIDAIKAKKWQGAVFDFENMPDSALPPYHEFLRRAHQRFAAAGLELGLTIPAGEPSWNLKRMSDVVDHVFFMNYDLHWQGGEPGPIAPQAWFASQLAHARSQVPARKLIVALGNYGYDWHDGVADALTVNEAWLAAHDSDTVPKFDPASGNSGFAYEDEGHTHTVWLMDAATSWNQLSLLQGVEGVALWRLGSEDPGIWEVFDAMHAGRKPQLASIPPNPSTDVEGSGEILRIGAEPHGGSRQLRFDPSGLVADERIDALPTPYEVQRTGGADPKLLALTFDDGPDPDYTPKILSVLERAHVPATFFIIGENGLDHPEILRRIERDGSEIGNHSYTHPNMAEEGGLGTLIELNATQRLIEAYTGRSTRLFRAPYFGDAEPTTLDELKPALLAQQRGYTIVGLHVDPGDWRTPGVQQIIDRTMEQVAAATPDRSTNIILLHDGGGNRDQTVAALPIIIEQLKAKGYRFVPVSQLAGLSRDAVMPRVDGRDMASVRADVAVFAGLAAISYGLRWIFFFAIALGVARAVFLTALALMDRKTGAGAVSDAPQPPVSVIIPAYNEEKVIVASIARVLASDYPALELIVADDGSKDATSRLVAERYGSDPRVRLLTLANGGKASALNRALTYAKGEIVIALDADTQFLPDTIAKLVRWFADERIGAVAGNARVGNRINLVTRWQAIEYVTAQNVERRALDSLGAITVVPGAVGAWRLAALVEVGGYPEDTLAEDQDLTIAIQRKGWRVAYDVEAIALTEAPETLRALGKQRYRWSFGTLQCLWKHRAVFRTGRPRGLALFGMPQAWLFQILFAALSPIIDLALVISIVGTVIRVQQHGWDQTQSDVLRMGVYWCAFVGIDLIAGWIAYRLEPRRQRFPGLLMVMQRLVYRQLMYGVVLRSISAALRGKFVGWGKLERTGTVSAGVAE